MRFSFLRTHIIARLAALAGIAISIMSFTSCGASHQEVLVRTSPLESQAGSVPGCSDPSEALIDGSMLGTGFSVISSLSTAPPQQLSLPGTGGSAALGAEWVMAETLNSSDSPGNIGPENVSSQVLSTPSELFSVTETSTYFDDATDATSFAAAFIPESGTGPQVPVGAGLEQVNETELTGTTQLGDQSYVTEQSLPGSGIPNTIQVIVRSGSIVMTLAFEGGNSYDLAQIGNVPSAALQDLLSACG